MNNWDFLKTGDLLFCDYTGSGPFGWFSYLLKFFTKSKYSHSAMIIRDPPFSNVEPGLYVWESTYNGKPDPQDHKIKLGVQLATFEDFYNNYHSNGTVYIRQIEPNNPITNDQLIKIHNVVYDKPYDILPEDWIEAYLRTGPKDTIDRFWCSALVGYIYTQLNLFNKDTDWSMLRPADIANNIIKVQNGKLEPIKKI